MATLHTLVSKNVGQVKVEDAKKEIDRLEKQTKKKWRMDFSEFMEEADDTEFPYPVELSRGYCWIVQV